MVLYRARTFLACKVVRIDRLRALSYTGVVAYEERVRTACSETDLLSPSVFFSGRSRHTRLVSDWSSDVCSSDLLGPFPPRIDDHVRGVAAVGDPLMHGAQQVGAFGQHLARGAHSRISCSRSDRPSRNAGREKDRKSVV